MDLLISASFFDLPGSGASKKHGSMLEILSRFTCAVKAYSTALPDLFTS
jgi:hypothetical protein